MHNDIVTQHNSAQSWAETRTYSAPDANWQSATATLNGQQLINGTVHAHALSLDGVTLRASPAGALSVSAISASQITGGHFISSNYEPGSKGFNIQHDGDAEFNDVVMRGRMESGTVSSSLLIAPKITLPTEEGGRFLTTSRLRDVMPLLTYYSGGKIIMGRLIIRRDNYSVIEGDKNRPICMANDRLGDNAAGDLNTNYSRFRKKSPSIKITCRYFAPRSTTPWGTIIQAVRPQITVRTNNNVILAQTQFLGALENMLSAHHTILYRVMATGHQFDGVISAQTTYKEKHRSGYSYPRNTYTDELELEITFAPFLSPTPSLIGAELFVDMRLQITRVGRFPLLPERVMASNITFEMDNLG